jgi:hypothetical protein
MMWLKNIDPLIGNKLSTKFMIHRNPYRQIVESLNLKMVSEIDPMNVRKFNKFVIFLFKKCLQGT